jgi:NADPH:quinone reductase-like Zn-dependent oxidoreductase
VASTTKVDLVRSLGADEVLDYTREDFADGARRWDLIVDTPRAAVRSPTCGTPSPVGGRW